MRNRMTRVKRIRETHPVQAASPMQRHLATSLLLAALLGGSIRAAETPAPNPNIVYVLCDDLGYGDVQCLNPQRGKIATPNIDRLAGQGLAFTDAHSSSAVCTPTRYGILTGRYNWRSRLQSGVLDGFSPPLIAAGRLTVPALLKQHGYQSDCLGKWHLGLTFSGQGRQRDLTQAIQDSPLTRGFDSFFGISASLDMPPFAFIENDRFTQAPTVTKTWGRTGPAASDFDAADVLPTLARKAGEAIARHSAAKQPFFLYLALTSPHTPLVPTKEWKGKSALGNYGDFVMETDWALGEVLAAIDKNGIADNTLVIFTSDNGCAPYIGVDKLEKQGHFPSADRRGYKSDIWDGGHHIPFIARWPGKIKPATRSAQTICLTDLMATCAEIVGAKLPDTAGEDSVSILPLLLGNAGVPPRVPVVHHSINGAFAIRQGPWKLELCAGSGGWSKGGDPAQTTQLYDMSQDVGEMANQAEAHPEIVEQMTRLLDKYVADGRSTPGAPQKNDVRIVIRKPGNVGGGEPPIAHPDAGGKPADSGKAAVK